MNVRVGVIGCGRIATSHVNALAKFSNVSITAISDPIVEHMQAIEKQIHSVSNQKDPVIKNRDYGELLLDPDIDVVLIASSSGTHARIAKQALEAGKHVVLEKPMALSIADAKGLITLADTTAKTLLVCHQMRYRPILRKIKDLITQGMLGTIYYGKASLRLHRSDEYFLASPWRGTWSDDGGMLLNQGIHMVDLLVWLLGDVKEAFGVVTKRSAIKEIEDGALGILSFPNNSYGLIEANTISYPNNVGFELSLFGEHGTIIIGGLALNDVIRWKLKNDNMEKHELELLQNDVDDRYYMYKDLLESIEQDRPVMVEAKEAYKALEAIFGIYQSSLTSLPISLPLQDFSTIWMKDLSN